MKILSGILSGDLREPLAYEGLDAEERFLLEEVMRIKASYDTANMEGGSLSGAIREIRDDLHKTVKVIAVFRRLAEILDRNVNINDVARMVVEIFLDEFDFEKCLLLAADNAGEFRVLHYGSQERHLAGLKGAR